MRKINKYSIYLEDARKIISELPDKSIDCMITDPPYGINHFKSYGYRWKGKKPFKKSVLGDDKNAVKLLQQVLKEVYPKLKPGAHIYVFTRWDAYAKWFWVVNRWFNIKNLLSWDKGAPTMGDLKGSYQENNEYIIYAVKPGKRRVLNGPRDKTLIQGYKRVFAPHRKHPFEKPHELYEYLIKKSTEPGNVIIDPFAGSGPVIEAAVNTGRGFIAIDKDANCYDIQVDRFIKTLENGRGYMRYE